MPSEDSPALTEETITLDWLASVFAAAPRPPRMPISILAIDGGGGAGKSTLANRLCSVLNDCPVIHTDDFVTWDNFFGWQKTFLKRVLIPLSRNVAANYARFDWTSGTFGNAITVHPAPWIIIEGVGATHSQFRRFITYSIFVEADADRRLERGLARDGKESADFWKEWFAGERDYFVQHCPREFADLIVAGDPKTQHDPAREIIVLKQAPASHP